MANESGQIFDVFTIKEMDEIMSILGDLDQNQELYDQRKNSCRGVDENHYEYHWFMYEVFGRIQKLLGEDLHLQFGMNLNEEDPWCVHTDSYHTKGFADREPAISMLVPYSLDHDLNNLKNGYTIVFNERALDNDDILDLPDQENSAMSIYQEHLSHNDPLKVKKLTVKDIFQWTPGSLIYWDSLLVHDSNNFLDLGMTSKQALVIHTYRKSNT